MALGGGEPIRFARLSQRLTCSLFRECFFSINLTGKYDRILNSCVESTCKWKEKLRKLNSFLVSVLNHCSNAHLMICFDFGGVSTSKTAVSGYLLVFPTSRDNLIRCH